MGHVVGDIYSEVGFGGHFPPFLTTKQAQFLHLLLFFLKKLFERPSVFLFMIGKSQYCSLVNFRSSKIWCQKLNQLYSPQKCSWLTYEPQFLATRAIFLAQIHNTSLKLVPTVNFQPNSKNSFIWIIHEQTVCRNLNGGLTILEPPICEVLLAAISRKLRACGFFFIPACYRVFHVGCPEGIKKNVELALFVQVTTAS